VTDYESKMSDFRVKVVYASYVMISDFLVHTIEFLAIIEQALYG